MLVTIGEIGTLEKRTFAFFGQMTRHTFLWRYRIFGLPTFTFFFSEGRILYGSFLIAGDKKAVEINMN
jgi:hypothetical protein